MTYSIIHAGGPRRNERLASSLIILLASVVLLSFLSIPTALAAGGVRIVKSQHPHPVKHTLQKAGKRQLHKYKPQGLKTSSKAATHKSKIAFKKQLRSSNGVYFLDDMESGINGWTVDTHSDTLWHQTENDYASPTHSWWCGIDSTGTYNTGSRVNQSLISPPIDLTGATLPIHLMFNESFITEWGKDFCTVGVSMDGGVTWDEQRSDTNSCSGSSGGWIITDINLSNYANTIINLRFHFDTGDELNNDFPGWHIDNVVVFTGGTISGVTYFDINRNGIRDTLERPMSGWMMTASSNLFSFTTWTDDLGMYSFALPPGTYTVTEELRTGWTPTSPSSGSWQTTLDPTQSVNDTVNFGNWHSYVTLSGYVFNDANYNGIKDSSETLVANQQIGIDGPNGFEQYQFTDSSAHFSFTVTDTGKYYIWEELPDTIIQTFPPNWGANEISVHDLSTNITDLKFGNYYPPPYGKTCAIGGWLFNDLNKNGIRDGNEPGIGGLRMTLDGDLNGTTITDSTGHYSFDSLYPGYYEVAPETPDNWIIASPEDLEYDFDIPGGIRIDTANFGCVPPPLIFSGYVFNDLNHNGIQDSSEPLVANQEIEIEGPHHFDTYQATDSAGHFSIGAFETGTYDIWENLRSPNFQTYPSDDEEYEITIDDLPMTLTHLAFGNYYPPPYGKTCTIGGWVFNDQNRNGVRDGYESGIAGIEVDLSGDDTRTILSDSTGHYSFDSLYPGTYSVAPGKPQYWVISSPVFHAYRFRMMGGYRVDTATFGEFRSSRSASVSGQCFNDANKNGVRDPGESGIGAWTITLTGNDCDRNVYRKQVNTDGSGNYFLDSLWAGSYMLSASLRSRWVQTLPPDFRPIIVTLDTATHRTSCDFGNSYDTTFSAGYRTFMPESIAHAMSYDGKKFGTAINKLLASQAIFTVAFANTVNPLATATGLQVIFQYPIFDSLAVIPPAGQSFNSARTSVILSFPGGVPSSQTVQIQGVCTNPKPATTLKQSISHASWVCPGGSRCAKYTHGSLNSTLLRYIMPNAVDMLMAAMIGHTIQVGLSLDRNSSHTVLMKHYSDVAKSLVDSRGTMHTGTPTCLGTYTGGASIRRQATSLPPSKQDNMLFAEAVALKANLLASVQGVTPPGFGDLIFDEGGDNPFNGKSIQFIAGVLDQYMSSYRDLVGLNHCQMPAGYEWFDPASLYRTIRKIDSAFCGPIDYTYWKPGGSRPGLTLTAVKAVTDIPYIHIDSSFAAAGKDKPVAVVGAPEPDRFELLQNYPNPFNPTTTIEFYMKQPGVVTLKVYNTVGQEVAALLNQEAMEGGWQHIEFSTEGRSFASGVYFYRIAVDVSANDEEGITAQHFSSVRKMLMLK